MIGMKADESLGKKMSAAASPGPGEGYKWIALSNTTLGTLMASINNNIVLISLPSIFNGLGINPLAPNETFYLLWILMGYSVVVATLLVSFGRLSDMFGRVRLYNLGFAIFTAASILLFLTPGKGDTGAMEVVVFRMIQAIGGGFLFANSSAILTDAFPPLERGMALGLNQIAFISGSLIGLILGGFLAVLNWRLVFLVSVPVGIAGTVWAYLKLKETGTISRDQKLDLPGVATFGAGLIVLMIALNYGIMPHGHSVMGWGNPLVVGGIVGGLLLIVAFIFIEQRVRYPMFRLNLFKNRIFAMGNLSGFLFAVAQGGLQFMLIIWLQGIWLPLHGYNYEDTPLWAGIYMAPMLIGFFLMGPLSGWLSDRHGSRGLATLGLIVVMAGLLLLVLLPANFPYAPFMFILILVGAGMGLFSSPNMTAIMNAVPPELRGAASGMRATIQNAGTLMSMSLFFSVVIIGLAQTLPQALYSGLVAAGIPADAVTHVASLPPTGALFAAFLGYNPMSELLPPATLANLPEATRDLVLGKQFFPSLMAQAFMASLRLTFYGAAALACLAAIVSFLRGGGKYIHGLET